MKLPSPALIVATVALFVALGGTSYAVMKLPKNSVGSEQIKNGSIRAADLSKAVAMGAAGAKGDTGTTGPKGADAPTATPCTWVWGGSATSSTHTVCTNHDLVGLDVGRYLAHADLTGSNLMGLSAKNVLAYNANFTRANLTHSDFLNVYLTNVNLTGADMTDASFTNVTWTNTTCPDGSNSDNNSRTCVGHLTV